MKSISTLGCPVWKLLPYANQGAEVLRNNQLTSFRMDDTQDLKGLHLTGLCEFTRICFIRLVFKSISVRNYNCFFYCYRQLLVGITYRLLHVYRWL